MLRTAALCWLWILAAAAPAAAEWHITPMVGLTFGGNTTFADFDVATGNRHAAVGIAGTWLSHGIIGAEAIGTLTPGFFQVPGGRVDASRSSALMGNLVVTAPRKYTEYFLRPFVSGGFGLLRVTEEDRIALGTSVIDLKANLAGFDIGGGAIGFLSQSVGVRFDLRYYSTIHSSERPAGEATGQARLRYVTASIGLVIRP